MPPADVPSIVFIHGLRGDREKTWTATHASEPWPKALLPSKLPTARILTFGYDAYVAELRGVVSQSRIRNHASSLVASLASYREEDDTVSASSRVTSINTDVGRTIGRLYLSVIA